MANKVIVDYIGIPHFYARCQECSWSWENHREREKGVREIRKHVSKTGHTVALEKAVCINYVAAEQSVHPTCATCGDFGRAYPTLSDPDGVPCPDCGASG